MKEDKICISKLAHDKKAFQNHYMRTYIDRARLTACEVRVFSFQQLIKGTDSILPYTHPRVFLLAFLETTQGSSYCAIVISQLLRIRPPPL